MFAYGTMVVATVFLVGALFLWRRNQTALRKAKAHWEIMSAVVEQSPSVVGITDLEGNITYANPAFQK